MKLLIVQQEKEKENVLDSAYAEELAITGIANNPVPIIPSAKIVFAVSPALGKVFTRGSSAFAA
jgi:hypothetical protein